MALGWTKIGEFKKTKRKDMLVGHIEFKDLNVKLKVFAFLKTSEQKRNKSEPDIVILLPKEENDKGVEIPDSLFSD